MVAAELRRRGYDVIVRPAPLGPDGKFDPSDTIANNWPYLFKNAKWKSSRDKTGIDQIIDAMPEDARGTVYLEWDPSYQDGAHVFRFEKTRTGIRYYDPQTGRIGCDSYFNHRRPGTRFLVARTDNLEVDERFIDDIIEETGPMEEA